MVYLSKAGVESHQHGMDLVDHEELSLPQQHLGFPEQRHAQWVEVLEPVLLLSLSDFVLQPLLLDVLFHDVWLHALQLLFALRFAEPLQKMLCPALKDPFFLGNTSIKLLPSILFSSLLRIYISCQSYFLLLGFIVRAVITDCNTEKMLGLNSKGDHISIKDGNWAILIHSQMLRVDLDIGNDWLGSRLRDSNDYEWEAWITIMKNGILWSILHPVITRLLAQGRPPPVESTEGDYEVEYIIMVTTAWTAGRCLSFSLDSVEEGSHWSLTDLSLKLGYVFYFPLAIGGPLTLFTDYKMHIMRREVVTWHSSACLLLVRAILWCLVYEFFLHHVHLYALRLRPDLVENLDNWSLCGLGYFLGQMFMLKYFTFYGTASALTQMDGFYAPPPPRCIAHIVRYSEMWRHFDHGLHRFLRQYLHLPCTKELPGIRGQITGSLLSFGTVCMWHGAEAAVIVWASLNFAGIVLEILGRKAIASSLYQVTIKRRLEISEDCERRLLALACVPLYIMSSLSNFYFLGGQSGSGGMQPPRARMEESMTSRSRSTDADRFVSVIVPTSWILLPGRREYLNSLFPDGFALPSVTEACSYGFTIEHYREAGADRGSCRATWLWTWRRREGTWDVLVNAAPVESN
ncbi:unnamed protein product [Darwinula stevensoni]|uniref:Uncharacterized protein n=1 Tax=Darwinula stevensoni TaxID=69355 RepID=A0A7R9A0A6_9CRUS|nr:unnamed protein product [Darwinula stevensoni]CAG0880631.1 unnamed protein product [Darwinula stevensoni]